MQAMRKTPTNGFTLVELLIVVVIVGILAAIALPRFSRAREDAHLAAMKSDLHGLDLAQHLFHETPSNNYDYADDWSTLPDFRPSPSVGIVIEEATKEGWSARVSHAALPGRECVVFHGTAAPLTTVGGLTPAVAGFVACDS